MALVHVLFVCGIFGLATGDFQQRSRRLVGSEIATETVRNFIQCKEICARRSSCKSVNYDTRTRQCTSNYDDITAPGAVLQSDLEWVVFAEKSAMSQVRSVLKSLTLILPVTGVRYNSLL